MSRYRNRAADMARRKLFPMTPAVRKQLQRAREADQARRREPLETKRQRAQALAEQLQASARDVATKLADEHKISISAQDITRYMIGLDGTEHVRAALEGKSSVTPAVTSPAPATGNVTPAVTPTAADDVTSNVTISTPATPELDDERVRPFELSEVFEVDVVSPRGGVTRRGFQAHPLAMAIPPMTERERERLRESIAALGVLVPLVIYQDKVLDGRERLYCASTVGKPVQIEEFKGTEDEARKLVAIKNLIGRHLFPAQPLDAPRPMKMGTTVSPWRHDVAARHALRSVNL
jgi:hypothetical protein